MFVFEEQEFAAVLDDCNCAPVNACMLLKTTALKHE